MRKEKSEVAIEREQLRLLRDSVDRMQQDLTSEKAEIRSNIDKKVLSMLESEKRRYELLIT